MNFRKPRTPLPKRRRRQTPRGTSIVRTEADLVPKFFRGDFSGYLAGLARRFAFQTKDRWEQRDGVMQLVVELRLIPMTVTT